MVFSGRITFDDHKEYDLSATFADHAPQWISHRAQNSKERRLEETSMSLRLVNDTIEKINASLTRVRLSHIVYLGQLLHAADQVGQNSLNRLGRVSVLHFPDDVDGHDDQVGRSVANRAAFEKVFTVCVTISASAGSTTLRVQGNEYTHLQDSSSAGTFSIFPTTWDRRVVNPSRAHGPSSGAGSLRLLIFNAFLEVHRSHVVFAFYFISIIFFVFFFVLFFLSFFLSSMRTVV